MKLKRLLIVPIVISLLLIGFYMGKKDTRTYNEEIPKVKTSKKELSMMLETGSNTGVYELTTRSEWPSDGYMFNSSLSKCENGSSLSWDEEENTVVMSGNVSDKCYVYFDKYELAVINNVTSTSTPSSITISLEAINGTNMISKYMYSINDGEYVESTTNSYTFSNLSESTTYTIKTKVVDTLGKESVERIDTITTSAYVLPTITSLTTSVTTSTIKVTPVITQGTGTVSKYYYSKDGGSSYTESTSSSYTFTGLTGGTTYSIKVYVKDSNGKSSSIYTKSIMTSKMTLADACTSGSNLASCVKKLYTNTQGGNDVYYHTSTLTNGAGDNSYRYAGASASVNNYVCFGSDASTCPTDNLYRIIGVFEDQVKLIKSTLASSTQLGTDGAYKSSTTYYWNNTDSSSYNAWSESNLNTTNLNGNYITYLNNQNTKWANMIATTTWQVGGNTYENIRDVTAPNAYKNEITFPAESTTHNAKIGLMYVSDYGFAATQSAWTTTLYNYNSSSVTAVNWMYSGSYEWTITNCSTGPYYAFTVNSTGIVNYFEHVRVADYGVRPVFYLNSSVTKTGGSGTSTDPYRVA